MDESDASPVALTFDIDWAPDWCIAACLDLIDRYRCPATFFVTHPSPILDRLRATPGIELGLHPNLLPSSTQGRDAAAVMDYCSALVPEARALRTHSLVQSSPFLALLAEHYPRIATDVSLLLPLHPNLQPVEHYCGQPPRRLIRLPYFWEDDVFAGWPGWRWDRVPVCRGLRIFDFHPVYVALNMRSMDGYRRIKAGLGSRPLFDLRADELAPFVEAGPGTRRFLIRLLEETPRQRFRTVSQLSEAVP